MQLKKNFNKTLILSVLFGLIDILLGLFLSYHFDSAPGGTIALTSVIVLVITLILKRNDN